MQVINQFRGEYSGFSSFALCQVMMDQVEYPSVEHAYQAAKTLNKNERDLFLGRNVNAGRAKRLGRTITIRSDWEDIKINVMKDLCRQKYNNPKYRELLLSTGNALIQEGNNWGDRFWGVDLQSGVGDNNLGRIIMDMRKDLQLNQTH